MEINANSNQKNMNLPITVIVLTKNEELHIKRFLDKIAFVVEQVFIIDSYSNDETLAIARKYKKIKIFQHKFENYASQFNWALKNCPIKTEWVLRLDADEYLENKLVKYLKNNLLKINQDVNGIYFRRKVIFRNQWIRFGGFYPTWLLRLFRYQKAVCETRHMDEHIKILDGTTMRVKKDIVDYNLNSLSFWTQKHDWYATREAVDYLLNIKKPEQTRYGGSQQDQKRRWLKNRLYNRAPLFLRVYCYYFYRYLILLGFLDGLVGLQFHFLQCFWYRFLVDSKIYEIKKYQEKHRVGIIKVVKILYNYQI
ncbi:glycosyltransferase family 2 protein [Candidatus Berkelbacteria bacterium CG10_big_fil_rev_8_21_14_0_10_33_10]|nr:MAG: glycosyltransferase family 2 protein [Candidatus Berkelbacteria bacterium CG10_big_fil_rev_8_21_14_0_10_33_10]